MSNLLDILGGQILHCSIIEGNDGLHISCHTQKLKPISETYIYHKNDKGKPDEMDLPLSIK